MRNLKVTMAYNGTAYHGYQRQNNANSIQQTVEEVLSKLLCEDMPDSFHARFDSKGKEYIYRIYTGDVRDVFSADTALHYPYKPDIEKMRKAARLIVGEHDFASFCKAEAKEHLLTTVRTVYSIDVEQTGDFVEIKVCGNGFLHNMVRIIVGTLIYISEGKRTELDIINALTKPDREFAGKTVSPCGLYLNKVFYENDV